MGKRRMDIFLKRAASRAEVSAEKQRGVGVKWCAMQGLNLRHLACEASALPLS